MRQGVYKQFKSRKTFGIYKFYQFGVYSSIKLIIIYNFNAHFYHGMMRLSSFSALCLYVQ